MYGVADINATNINFLPWVVGEVGTCSCAICVSDNCAAGSCVTCD